MLSWGKICEIEDRFPDHFWWWGPVCYLRGVYLSDIDFIGAIVENIKGLRFPVIFYKNLYLGVSDLLYDIQNKDVAFKAILNLMLYSSEKFTGTDKELHGAISKLTKFFGEEYKGTISELVIKWGNRNEK